MAILQRATSLSSWGWTSLAAAALIASGSRADARDNPRLRIELDATSLPAAIAELSREAQISIGTEGTLPDVRTRALHGSFTVEAALARLLRGTGYVARQVSPTAWRIERGRTPPPVAAAASAEPVAPPPMASGAEIVVSATKRNLTLDSTPLAATVMAVEGAAGADPKADTQRVAERVEGLSLTGQGDGRNRMFLRGVADSPFGGKSQATVAVLLDDARLTYVAPDPDIRLVDVDRVELLKGPQGSLYGSGALGGIYRIVTRRADPSAFSIEGSVSGEAMRTGGLGGGGSLVVNLPLVADFAALRVVGYGEKSPGWIDTGGHKESNGTTVAGLRAGLGVNAGGGWRADVTGFGQWLQSHDSNYTYTSEAHSRPAQLPEPHQNDILHGSIRLAHAGSTQVVLSTGYTVHDVDDRYDATIGAESLGLADPQTLNDDGNYRLWDNEARVSGSWGRLGWLGGLSHIEAGQNSTRMLNGAASTKLALETVDRQASETALFGEATLPLSSALDATLGGRLFHTALHEDRTTTSDEAVEETRRTGVTPSASLSWHPREGRLLFVRYGSAVRQGGTTVGSGGEIEQLDEDELKTLEGGWRETGGRFQLDLSLYHSWWSDVQSDILLSNGLVETANVGTGAITGAELSLTAHLSRGWHLDSGAMVQSAMLTHDMTGFELHDRRLPVVPSWTLRSALAHDFGLGAWDGTVAASARYVGPARLSFDPALDRPMGDYVETGLTVEARRDQWTVGMEARNLLGSRGEVFAYGNPLRIASMLQFIQQEPLSLRLSITYSR